MIIRMKNKPSTLKEGLAVGAGLVVIGLLLQLGIGPVTWELFAWPVNIITVGCWLLATVLLALCCHRSPVVQFLGSHAAAIPALGYALLLTVIMGLTEQHASGTWLSNMLRFWPFVLVYGWIVVILSLVVVRRLMRLRRSRSLRDMAFLLNHVGLLVALVCATLGNPDMKRLKIICTYGEPEWRAIDEQSHVVELPLSIELKQFILEEYADERMPKRFASDILIQTASGQQFPATVEVNKPAEVEGWKIYQYGYDQQMGASSQVSIFELVTDPWLPAVYTGIYMLLAGAFCMLIFGVRKS